MSLSHALASDLVHVNDAVAAAINHFNEPLPLHPSNAQPEFVEMIHVRAFQFEEFSNDAYDAFALSLNIDGPCMHELRDYRLMVLETNGEAVMNSLRNAGLSFTYESFWLPSTEYWLAGDDAVSERDVDNWH